MKTYFVEKLTLTICLIGALLAAYITFNGGIDNTKTNKTYNSQVNVSVMYSDNAIAESLWEFFEAIEYVEGWKGPRTLGDGSEIGPCQITYNYWKDSEVPGTFKDCEHRGYSRIVVVAYMRRYQNEALMKRNYEVLARTHNGGPTGYQKESTLQYWLKVKSYMDLKRQGRE